MHHRLGRDLEGVLGSVAQEKRRGWTEFNGKINSRRKPVLLFSFFITAADTSGICRKLPTSLTPVGCAGKSVARGARARGKAAGRGQRLEVRSSRKSKQCQ